MTRRIILGLLCLLLVVSAAPIRSFAEGTAQQEFNSLNDLSKCTIGVTTGTIHDKFALEYIDSPEIMYYNSTTDAVQALMSGRIDSILMDIPVAKILTSTVSGLTYINEIREPDVYGYAFSKTKRGAILVNQMNELLDEMKNNGKLDEIDKLWTGTDTTEMLHRDFDNLPATNGTVAFATDGTLSPFSYYLNGEIVGYDLDIIYYFCERYGYGIEIKEMNFGGIIPSLSAGKADIAGASISITEERQQSVYFSIPYYNAGVVAVVRTVDETEKVGFLENIVLSFQKNFIRENRWKLILDGLLITIIISILAAIMGTIFGFVLCLIRRSKFKTLARIVSAFIRIIQGIPVVVLLMILYYVVFSSNVSGILIASIGFAINFGVYVSEMMRAGIDAVGHEQWEASSALGFDTTNTFVQIIAPQALKHIIPVYKGEFISMVKMTSVVGYIAIEDLTKVSDIIRSRTYDSFFPLIATALIYFLLAWTMTLLIGMIETKIDPKHRSRTIKKVNTQDNTTTSVTTKRESKEKTKDTEVIRIEHLKKSYSNVTPLMDVNASIRKGDVVTIIGPSGTGKSTLLRCLNELETATDGKITVLGKTINTRKNNINALRQKMAMVFQSFNLFPHLTVIENIMLAPMKLKKLPRQAAYNKAIELLRVVGLAEKASSYPDELSGGQKQRVAIARALAMDPEIVLFDEPTSALDPTMVGEVLAVIRELASKGLTMLIVTHEMKFARDVSSRIFYMDEGIVYEEGTPSEIFDNPKRDKTRTFVKRLKTFERTITSKDFDYIAIQQAMEDFGLKNFMSQKQLTALRRCFEEIFANNILPRIEDSFKATVSIEYNEAESCTIMSFTYDGDTFNPITEGDELSMMIIKSTITDFKYYHDGNNKLVVRLK